MAQGNSGAGIPTGALKFPWRRLVIGIAATGIVAVIAVSVGSVDVPPLTILKIVVSRWPGIEITQDWPASFDTIVWQLRLPRIVLAGIVGASLAVAGTTYQGLFRNPLADPYLIGVASGAGLGATIVLVTGVPTYFNGFSLLPLAAFGGAIATVSAAYMIARSSEGLPLATLILAGVAIASLTTAATTLLLLSSEPELRPVLSWLLGGFISAQWRHTAMILPYLAPAVFTIIIYARILNVMQLTEDHAKQLGVSVERTKLLLISAASLATAAAVAFAGPIGFVGLVAPHIVRITWGVDHRSLLPMSAIVGAVMLISADLVARTVLSPGELPVGVVTAFLGAPFFLFLLWQRRGLLH